MATIVRRRLPQATEFVKVTRDRGWKEVRGDCSKTRHNDPSEGSNQLRKALDQRHYLPMRFPKLDLNAPPIFIHLRLGAFNVDYMTV